MKQSLPLRQRARQQGLTLVELMVAIVLMLIVTLATVALYGANSADKRTVDASQSMDDTARFVFEMIGQAIRNAGYPSAVNLEGPLVTYSNLFNTCDASASTEPCPVLGFDKSAVSATNYGSAGSGTVNNSDSLAIRFYGSSAFDASGAKVADNTVFTCTGAAVPASTTMGELGLSVFSVRLYQGEPELYCSSNPGSGTRTSAQIARGVESFQVMYGVDLCTGTPCTRDGVPDRWVSAADVASADWRHVRAVRVGLVLRGSPGSSQASDGQTLYPLGEKFVSGVSGAGLSFTPPADGRLRRTYVTTYMLRNSA